MCVPNITPKQNQFWFFEFQLKLSFLVITLLVLKCASTSPFKLLSFQPPLTQRSISLAQLFSKVFGWWAFSIWILGWWVWMGLWVQKLLVFLHLLLILRQSRSGTDLGCSSNRDLATLKMTGGAQSCLKLMTFLPPR